MGTIVREFTYQRRMDALRATKLEQTRQKHLVDGYSMDEDDHGLVLPPPELRGIVTTVGPSGNTITDVVLNSFEPVSNHPSGGFFGPKVVGENFKLFLQAHPTYVNAMSSLAGGYMAHFRSYRNPHWKPDLDYGHLREAHETYKIVHGIGGSQHFCPDVSIGLQVGWGGLLNKVRHHREISPPERSEFYDGLESVIIGIQDWILRHAEAAQAMARDEETPESAENLQAIARISERLATDAPRTFREACQWLAFFVAAARMYNGSGSLGQLDELLRPYYEQDTQSGLLTDEEALFHLACLLLVDPQYAQLGGPDATGKDVTSPVSFLILEAVHRLRTPANIGIRVHDGLNGDLLRRGVEILFEDKQGFPKFLGDGGLTDGFMRNGYPVELARRRTGSAYPAANMA